MQDRYGGGGLVFIGGGGGGRSTGSFSIVGSTLTCISAVRNAGNLSTVLLSLGRDVFGGSAWLGQAGSAGDNTG
jgi:hypothetical protein